MTKAGTTASARRTAGAFTLPPPSKAGASDLLAVDPGGRWCGMAQFTIEEGRWVTIEAYKTDPRSCVDQTRAWLRLRDPAVLVVEEFRLYPKLLQEHGFSSFGTVEVIGALKWVFLERGNPNQSMHMQGASLKQHGARYMARMGLEHKGPNIHARDAEVHGWWRIHKLLGD